MKYNHNLLYSGYKLCIWDLMWISPPFVLQLIIYLGLSCSAWPMSVRTGLLCFHSSDICPFSRSRLSRGSAAPPPWPLKASVTCCSTVSPSPSSAPFRSASLQHQKAELHKWPGGFIRCGLTHRIMEVDKYESLITSRSEKRFRWNKMASYLRC